MKKITIYFSLALCFWFILIAGETSAQICSLNSAFTHTQGVSGQVNFSSTSTGTVAGTTYTWNYGDATSGNGVTSSHTYATNGYYNVVLTASNNFSTNCVDSVTIPVMVSSYPCTLTAGYNYTLGASGLVSFNSASTGTDSGTTYTWTLGDSNTNYGASTNHVYANGTYTVYLTAMNSLTTCISTATQVITVSNATCNINTSFSFTQGANGLVNFNSTSTGTAAGTTYIWSFGDSSPSGSGPSTSHTYSANGTYYAYLYANNNYSTMCADSSAFIPIVVNSFTPCTLNANYTFAQGSNGNVNFSSTSTGTNASTTYFWNFGDALSGSGNPVLHQYASSGTYIATLTAVNSSSACSSSITKTIVVTLPCTLTASFTHTAASGGVVNFNAVATGTNSGSMYAWNFGDGHTSLSNTPTHTYASNGAYIVSLLIFQPGCSDTVVQSVNVTSGSCLANASFSLAQTSTPQYWTATVLYPWNVSAATWYWGDNTSSGALNASHTYSAPGTYSICLSVTVSCGASNSHCVNQFIFKSTEQNAQMVYINVATPPLIPEGIKDVIIENSQWIVYPNPNNGHFEIKMDETTNETLKIKIYNLIGEVLYSAELTNNDTDKKIDLDNISNGIYFIKVNSNSKEYTKKIIVNK